MKTQEQLSLFSVEELVPGRASASVQSPGDHSLFSLPENAGQAAHPQASARISLREQSAGQVVIENHRFRYRGYVLDLSREETWYVAYEAIFSPLEADVEKDCPPDRLADMLDLVGRSRRRQEEIARYGQRKWHSIYRPESASLQAVDWAFLHLVEAVGLCLEAVEPFFLTLSVQRADAWTYDLALASRQWWYERERFFSLLAEAGVPADVARQTFLCIQRGLRPRIRTK